MSDGKNAFFEPYFKYASEHPVADTIKTIAVVTGLVFAVKFLPEGIETLITYNNNSFLPNVAQGLLEDKTA